MTVKRINSLCASFGPTLRAIFSVTLRHILSEFRNLRQL